MALPWPERNLVVEWIDEIGAPVERAAEKGRRHGVVDDEQQARLMRDPGDRLEIDDAPAGLARLSTKIALDSRRDGAAEVLGIVGIGESDLPAEFLEALAELGDRAAIELVEATNWSPGSMKAKKASICAAWPEAVHDGAAAAFERWPYVPRAPRPWGW